MFLLQVLDDVRQVGNFLPEGSGVVGISVLEFRPDDCEYVSCKVERVITTVSIHTHVNGLDCELVSVNGQGVIKEVSGGEGVTPSGV